MNFSSGADAFFDVDEELFKNNPLVFESLPNEEKTFRKAEVQKVKNLLEENQRFCHECDPHLYLSLGAGCQIKQLQSLSVVKKNKKFIKFIWVFRKTDEQPRIFLDRPNVLVNKSPQEEYIESYKVRNPVFLEEFDEALQLPEGLKKWSDNLFDQRASEQALTLTPNLLRAKEWIKRLSLKYIELRDDFFEESQLKDLLKFSWGSSRIILSVRKENSCFFSNQFRKGLSFQNTILDCDVCLWEKIKDQVNIEPDMFSFHDGSVEEGILILKKNNLEKNKFLKLAPEVLSWKDLKRGHEWFLKSSNRFFLPRTPNSKTNSFLGLWIWYRSLLKKYDTLNFIRFYPEPLFPDQPFLSDINAIQKDSEFGAVLGRPIIQSFSAVEHNDLQKPFVAIPLGGVHEDSLEEALLVLKYLGLSFAAVTSPLKKQVASILNSNLQSVNTIWKQNNAWKTANTDTYAIQKFFKDRNINTQNTVLFGGAGLRFSFDQSNFDVSIYSPTLKKFLKGSLPIKDFYLIWAVPNKKPIIKPPQTWKPSVVFDMNYAQSSLGREYALEVGAKYTSGLEMFQIQAIEQKVIWKQAWKNQGNS